MATALMMGSRGVRRVPLDFDWPIDRVWEGFLVPDDLRLPDCADCDGGYGRRDIYNAISPGYEHRWEMYRAECERLGVSHLCESCGGGGMGGTPEQRKAYEAWQPTDPPTGDGFQVWESVSEGSPISPVFDTFDALCAWMADHKSPPGYSRTEKVWSADEWARALGGSAFAIEIGTGKLVA